MSFLRAEAVYRLQENQLLKLDQLIDWGRIGSVLGDLGRSGYGPTGYDPVRLVKCLVLQAWHHLSDPGLEEALKVRLDFMVFTGLERDVPDETTFCRFRGLLTMRGLWKKVFDEINEQLQRQGLMVAPTTGAVIDATIIESAARPRKEMKGCVVDRCEDEPPVVTISNENVHLSADPDASWLKKGKRSYFGYKGFIVTDSEQGYIHKVHTTPAHTSEVRTLPDVIDGLEASRLYGDKGYPSQTNQNLLKGKGIKNGLMYKASKGKPLTRWQKLFNKLVSKRRYIVEQAFGTLKRRFQFQRASYFTTKKVHTQMILKAISFNLLKALRQAQSI